MRNRTRFYINGDWVPGATQNTLDVRNPATEDIIGPIAMGSAEDVDRAVASARAAFDADSRPSREERLGWLDNIIAQYEQRSDELAAALSEEMGAPLTFAQSAQVPMGLTHLTTMRDILSAFEFEEDLGTTRIVREPIGVCGLITPWNWPLNQIACKVAPALAAGCTMVLKPSEVAPFSAILFAEIIDAAGVPNGVFNLVNGDGPTVGAALSAHPGVDMVSFTGSTQAGVEVARNAAPTVKRVAQELGGKSANLILDDANFSKEVTRGMFAVCANSGQSCIAPSRMLVPQARMEEAAALACAAAQQVRVGDPNDAKIRMGPVVSKNQFDRIQGLIQTGIEEGAKLEAGGSGRPDGLDVGYYIKPTVFSHVSNDMTIARQEIFGPVLCLIGYADEDDAVRIANDTIYGLSGCISSGDPKRARAVARRIRAGTVYLNGADMDDQAPFGGYKQSGNGREAGKYGLEEFLEIKAIMGYRG